MTDLLNLLFSDQLVIPFWQMGLFVLVLSIFVLARSFKVSLIITYLSTFYWGFSLYLGSLRNFFGTFPATVYVMLGFCHVGLILFSFLQEKRARS